jgi:hypothetical protein
VCVFVALLLKAKEREMVKEEGKKERKKDDFELWDNWSLNNTHNVYISSKKFSDTQKIIDERDAGCSFLDTCPPLPFSAVATRGRFVILSSSLEYCLTHGLVTNQFGVLGYKLNT